MQDRIRLTRKPEAFGEAGSPLKTVRRLYFTAVSGGFRSRSAFMTPATPSPNGLGHLIHQVLLALFSFALRCRGWGNLLRHYRRNNVFYSRWTICMSGNCAAIPGLIEGHLPTLWNTGSAWTLLDGRTPLRCNVNWHLRIRLAAALFVQCVREWQRFPGWSESHRISDLFSTGIRSFVRGSSRCHFQSLCFLDLTAGGLDET